MIFNSNKGIKGDMGSNGALGFPGQKGKYNFRFIKSVKKCKKFSFARR